MAYENVTIVNLVAGEDLREAGPVLVYIEDDSGIGKVIKTVATTDIPVGVLAENPSPSQDTDGYSVPVALLSGTLTMIAAGTITAGNLITPSATGGAVVGAATVPAGDTLVGVALESAVSGDNFSVLAQLGSAG